MSINQVLDNDTWFVLAEGRYLVQNGVHYTDVLTMHEDLDIVVQNYGFAMIFYLIHSIFGAPGLYAMMMVLNFVICFLIYKICMLLSNKNVNLSLFLMVITDVLLAAGFVVTRAQMVSYVIFMSLIYVLELYVKTGKIKYLCWLPILSLLQINLHASLWWVLSLVVLAYIVDSIKKPKLHLQGYKTKPLIVAGLMMLLSGLINPYGIKMVTYIFTSYGAPGIVGMVNEMSPFDLRSIFNVFTYVALVCVLGLYIFGNKRLIRVRHLLMLFGFLAIGLNTIKGLSQFILVMFFPLALVYKNVKIEGLIDAKVGRNAIILWTGVMTICLFVAFGVSTAYLIEDHPSDGVVGAVNAIEKSSGGNKGVKVYVGYNNGGYVEYRGFKPYLDPRAEIFLKGNNGKEDILDEWLDMVRGKMKLDEFLDKYDFDFLIVDYYHERNLYEIEDDDYNVIYENDDEKIKVYEYIDAKK